ncbi:LPP20 family lipoprotein [Carboxylicivirga sediminis]|uniref:LPP20 family lipoprotein n=1 Tax=Carboxylicivirga sediminis TaxID=2006564 RepID=A0A941FBP8_9BACT|nr:LPP20 family lipoprotein [Carboxylicivirga sediminis]MBR8538189.1 LPP20 family lipoprotein [Carboxylicivirga sediminis]
MNKQANLTLLLLLAFLLMPNISEAKKKPSWVKQRPNDPAYYIGIANVPKAGSAVEYRQAARGAALKQMSSEIKVNISSNSVLHKIETDYEYKEAYESKIQASVEQTLEGYEVLTWEDRKEYWVMTRLSKQKYERAKQMKLDKAKMMASSYLTDAFKAIDDYDAYSALNYLAKGVISLRDHLEEDLTYKTVDGTYNVGTELFSTIQDVFRRVQLMPVQSNYQIQFSKKLEVPIGVNATFTGKAGEKRPLVGFPLKYEFTKGEGILTAQSKTNYDGYTSVSITRLISKRKMQEITAGFDFSHVAESEMDDEVKRLLKVFFPVKQMPAVGITIEVLKSKAYLVSEEKVFGKLDDKGAFTGMLKTELNENFFTFTSDMNEADFVVTVNSNFVAGDERKGQGYSVFTVFADFNIVIQDIKSQTEIFADNLTGIRGMRPGNYEYALKDVRIKLIEQFKEQIEPRLEQVNM